MRPIKKNLLQLEKKNTPKKCVTVAKMCPSQKNELVRKMIYNRKKMGLSQKDLSRLINESQLENVSQLKNGSQLAKCVTIRKLC